MSNKHLATEDKHIPKEDNIEKKTGAKKSGKTIAALVLIGGLVIGGITGTVKYMNSETVRAKSLVSEYTDTDTGFLSLPQTVTVNQAYDLSYCDGEKLYNAITKNNIKYCEVLDEYYTSDGREIAVLNVTGTYTEGIKADCVEVNGTKIYMAPEGYELDGECAYRVINTSFKQIIEKQDDYSNIQVNGLDDVSIEIEEVHSRPFNDIISETLIVDVPDGAILNHNQECSGSFRLVPKE